MGQLITARVQITGIRPLLWHAFGLDAIPLERGERTGVAGNDPEEWKRTVLMTESRQLYIPGTYIFGTVRDGAKHIKKGRGSIQAAVASTLQVTEEIITIDRYVPEQPEINAYTKPVYLDVRSVRNPSTKGRNVRYRIATPPGWQLTFTLMWDRTVVSRNEMEAAVNDAGALAGLADGRTIGLGRFTVDAFDVVE